MPIQTTVLEQAENGLCIADIYREDHAPPESEVDDAVTEQLRGPPTRCYHRLETPM
jgi:hypothetical protein